MFEAALALGRVVVNAARQRLDNTSESEAERRAVGTETRSLVEVNRGHAEKVARVCSMLKARKSNRPLSLKKKAVSHVVPKVGDKKYSDDKIDITDFNAILHIDPERRLCFAEPGVTFVDLVAATMRYGLVPLVVPEMKTITIGGAVSGCSIESMSFQIGGFHDNCVEYEVITTKGEVLVCTPDNEHALVFQMIHGSFGTLGILSKLVFRLTPSKPYVRMTYEKYTHLADYKAAIMRHFERHDVDFMDGIIHSPTKYVLSVGTFVDFAPYTNSYDWLQVYWESTDKLREDYLKTPDYFFRYDRGVTNVHPRTWLGRLFFGKFLGSAELLRIPEYFPFVLKREKPDIICDVFIPFSKVDEFLAWYAETFRHFPLWCVPYKRVRDYEWLSTRFYENNKDPLFIDLAIYGMKQTGDVNYHELMEAKLLELGGMKTLISHNYYSEENFWKTWNKDNYEAAKKITDPDNLLRDLYTKTCKAAMGVAGA